MLGKGESERSGGVEGWILTGEDGGFLRGLSQGKTGHGCCYNYPHAP